ncbi:MAG: RidA family protein [Alphaproteobacteria bacterium]|nr:RidA family protein [Alphaproteobacteria bacterium]
MGITPIHHLPMKPEYQSPYSAAYAVEDARIVFFSGCCTVPIYHKHPHDPAEEAQWLAGDFREQTERTFEHIKLVLDAAGATFADIMKLTIYVTDISQQYVFNEISERYFGADNPPARTILQVGALPHPGMFVEVDGVAAVAKLG